MDNENQDELRKLSGGQKHMWLMEHQKEVLEYMAKHGKGAAMLKFRISHPDTLDCLVQRESNVKPKPSYFELMKAKGLAEMSLEGVRELRGQIRELKEQFIAFEDSVSSEIAHKFLIPLIQSIGVPKELPNPEDEPDILSLKGFSSKPYDVLEEACQLVGNQDNPDVDTLLLEAFNQAVIQQAFRHAVLVYQQMMKKPEDSGIYEGFEARYDAWHKDSMELINER